MAITDTLRGEIIAQVVSTLDRTGGNVAGADVLSHKKRITLTNGSGSGQASGQFGTTFTATTGGITISLADSADPLGAAGDDVPSSDPEGTKLKFLLIENLDSTNYVAVKKGTNGDTNVFTGSTDSVRIDAGGIFLWYSPAGSNAMSDGVDDEIVVTADTASCSVKITYLYG